MLGGIVRRAQHLVINFLVRNLLKSITVDDLFHQKDGHWFIGRRRLSKEDLMALQEEAESLLESEIWKVLTREMRFQSNLTMFEKAKTDSDMLFGKAMLYLQEQHTQFLKRIRTLK